MLSLTLGNALSGLKANQAALAVISQNVANANNADYSRQLITQESVALGGEVGNGVRLKEVTRAVDEFIARSVVTRGSDYYRTSTIKDYYGQVQQYFGQPGSNNSIDTYIDNFFNALNTLQNNPKDGSVKLTTVAAAETTAKEISNLALNIEETRFQADQAISASVDNVNFLVKQLQTYNSALLSAKTNNTSPSAILDSVQSTLNKLSAEIDITYRFDQDGTVSISGAGGINLLNGTARYELTYSPALSAEDFINGATTNEILVYAVSQSGVRQENPTTSLSTAGIGSEITTTLKSGKIKGLMEIRDTLLPDMLSQLDNLAANLRDEINAIHNKGSAFPPLAKLTGETLIDVAKPRAWSGSVMIAALNSDGTPISSNYATDTTGMNPLVIDLSKLNDGNGVGQSTMQTVIDEINNYYGAPQARVKVGPLSDIKLAATSDALDGNSGTFSFNLDFSNYSLGNANVVVTGVNVNNGATVSVPAAFPTSTYTVEKGTQSRGLGFTLDMSTGTNTNYAVSIDVQVTDADGNVSTETITYNLSEATEDLQNKRYVAASISGTGDGTLEAPNSLNPSVIAKMVDANGKELPKNSATGDYIGSGYLVIEGQDGTRIALSELDSKDLGYYNIDGSRRGFSHTLGLNNFFSTDGSVSNKNAAYNLSIRSDITSNPSNIAIGQLAKSNTDATVAEYTFELGESSTSIVRDMLEINLNNHNFTGSGSLPPISINFSGYAAQILGFVSSKTAESEVNAAQAELIYNGFADRDKNMRGVNIDEEMANTIIFQNAYAANARVINVVNQLFDDLLATFN